MNELILDYDSLDSLNRPVLIVAFKGLFDASGSATSALEWLIEKSESENIGEIDSETFFDFTQERPLISFDKNGERALTWPTNKIVAMKTKENERDLLAISGVEPHLRWRTFSELLIELVNKSNAESVLTLGSITGVTTEYEELDGPAADWQKQVDAAVASDDEITAYVTRLETAIDEDENLLPSGDDLAAEFEAFLREQDPD